MKVQFNSFEEFVADLRRARPNVERMVRVTNSFTTSNISPAVKHVENVAGFLRRAGDSVILVELTRYCGDLWGIGAQDDQVMRKATEFVEQIEIVCHDLGLEFGAGRYHEA